MAPELAARSLSFKLSKFIICMETRLWSFPWLRTSSLTNDLACLQMVERRTEVISPAWYSQSRFSACYPGMLLIQLPSALNLDIDGNYLRKRPRTHLNYTRLLFPVTTVTATATKQVNPNILQSTPKGESVVIIADVFASLGVAVFMFLTILSTSGRRTMSSLERFRTAR